MRNPSKDLLLAGVFLVFLANAAVAEEGSMPRAFHFSDFVLVGGPLLFSMRSALVTPSSSFLETSANVSLRPQVIGPLLITSSFEISQAVEGQGFRSESFARSILEASLRVSDRISVTVQAQRRFEFSKRHGGFTVDVGGTYVLLEDRALLRFGFAGTSYENRTLLRFSLQF